ncbi:MAG: hypothetical protein WAO76_13645 [Georgfuchsia sp.]
MSFENQILQAIKAVMPTNAEIQVVPGISELNIGVSWKLNDDPMRPNKMSKTISVCVSHEAAQDFASASSVNQGEAYQRVAEFLSAKLAQFDPQHNSPKCETPPVERWVISSAVVLG